MDPFETRIRAVVRELCAPALAGRRPGSTAGAAARLWLEGAFAEAGLTPAGERGYLQPIPGIDGANVLGRLVGSGPRADRTVILAAHHDVWSAEGSHSAYVGADDNAAAVGVLLACAEHLAHRRQELDRSLLFCAFDAEEPEFFLTPQMGSQYFVDNPTIALETVDMMVCLDLVGHAVGGPGSPAAVGESVFVLGAELSPGTGVLVDGVAPVAGIRPRRIDDYLIPPLSDYHAFARRGIAFLFYTCGRWAHYHAPTDTPEKLDYTKSAALARHLCWLLVELSVRREDRVSLTPGRCDDEATLRSLTDVTTALAPIYPPAGRTLAWLETVRSKVEAGVPLASDERAGLGDVVAGLEGALS